MALALALFLADSSAAGLPAQQWAGKKADVKARVMDYPEKRYHRCYYRLRVEEIDGVPVKPFTLRLSAATSLYCEPYDWVECPVGFYAFEEGGLYSQKNIRLAGGFQLGGYLAGGGGTRIPFAGVTLGKLLARLRNTLSRQFSQCLPSEDVGLLQAMVLGKRDGLQDEAFADFRLIGCAHLLVVSGLHMGAVAGLASRLLRRIPLRKGPRALLTTAVLAGYLCVTGFPVSAVRAFVMSLVYLLGGAVGRRGDSVNSLGFALLLICLHNPLSAGDLGLALSVFATLGIVTLAAKIKNAMLRPLEKSPQIKALCTPLAGGLSVTFSVTAATAPWHIAAFRGISLFAPLANLLLVLPCTLLLYCALLLLAFSVVPVLRPLARPLAFCAGWLSRIVRRIARVLASVPQAYVYLGAVQALLLLIFLLILLLLCLPRENRLRWRVMAGLLAVFIIAVALSQSYIGQGSVTIAVSGVGEDACIAIIQNHKAAILQAGAREGSCVSLLRRNQVEEVSSIFLPVDGADERRCVREIFSAFPVERLVLPEGAYVGRGLAPSLSETYMDFAPPGGQFHAFADMDIGYGGDGSTLHFRANGTGFTVELAESGPFLRVNPAGSENSSFTVLLADDIIDVTPGGELWQALSSGRYILPDSADGLRLVVGRGGGVAIQEGD